MNMDHVEAESSGEFYARTYDASVPDWPGELDFYRALTAPLKINLQPLLEVACGTGRVAIRRAQEGVRVLGLDLSAHMLQVASQKSAGMHNLKWVQADMCDFELGEQFGLVLIPGHSFQNLNTPQDQVACLECIRRHLDPGGRLVVHLDHQDFAWLGGLVSGKGGQFEADERFIHPQTGRPVQASRAWWYQPATQTATCQTVWEELGEDGRVLRRLEKAPVRMHCVFRFEMEHLFARSGYTVEAVYGDFFRHPLEDKSPQIVWLVRAREP